MFNFYLFSVVVCFVAIFLWCVLDDDCRDAVEGFLKTHPALLNNNTNIFVLRVFGGLIASLALAFIPVVNILFALCLWFG